ncbi:MAG: CCA tRNA nucleotidyltransferase [Puniceicoccaceae bacterium]
MNCLTDKFQTEHLQLIKQLATGCAAHGGRACLVGGGVRSVLLDEEVVDYDVEVFNLEAPELESVLSELVHFSRVGKSFGIYKLAGWPVDVGLPRRERKKGDGHRGFEVDIDPAMSIEEASRRRDFTVNAIYYDILEDRIVDPLGGVNDLENKLLRHCSNRFSEDPLRVLRAMQMASRLPATVDPATVELCRDLGPENLSRERFFGEWEKLLLLGKLPSRGLNFLKDSGWIRYFPSLEAMVDCPQDPRWHPEGDVWTHTLHCMDAAVQYRSGDRDDDLVLGLAVLCHDMGKPPTTEIVDEGIRSHGHESAGLRPATAFMKQLNVPTRIREKVLPLVKCHMRPAMLYADNCSAAAIRRLSRDAGRLDLLLKVFRSDAAGRPPYPDNSAPAAEWLLEKAQRMKVEKKAPEAILKGRHLLEKGWDSSPAMGRMLRKAYEAQIEGVFEDLEGALAWVSDQESGTSS